VQGGFGLCGGLSYPPAYFEEYLLRRIRIWRIPHDSVPEQRHDLHKRKPLMTQVAGLSVSSLIITTTSRTFTFVQDIIKDSPRRYARSVYTLPGQHQLREAVHYPSRHQTTGTDWCVPCSFVPRRRVSLTERSSQNSSLPKWCVLTSQSEYLSSSPGSVLWLGRCQRSDDSS